jgi:hypothetical protein
MTAYTEATYHFLSESPVWKPTVMYYYRKLAVAWMEIACEYAVTQE